MFDMETRHFIRCDTCPGDDDVIESLAEYDKDSAAETARISGWEIRDDLHSCPHCVREGRTERAS